MKRKGKILITLIVLVALFVFSIKNIYAASFSINASTSLEKGNTTTLTINSSGLTGRYDISSSNSSVVSVSQGSVWCENNSQSITLTAKSGGSATITVTPTSVADNDGNDYTGGARSITISVNEPKPQEVVTPTPSPEPTVPKPTPITTTPKTNNTNNASNNNNKDSNTYLSYLELSEEGMSPSFVKTKTNYSITVGMDVNEISVNAETEGNNSYYYVEGNTYLVEGDNTIAIVVVAENGSTRTYYVTVTKTANAENANAYLDNLIIENVELSPEFQSEVLEYDLGKVDFSVEKLNILTFPKNENASVEITGNDKLEVGENEIKITVTAVDGTTIKEYILKIEREEEVIEINALQDVKERSSFQKFKDFMENIWLSIKANALLVLMYAFIVVEFVQIVYLYKQLNKKEEILEKYGIDEKGNMQKSRSELIKEMEESKNNENVE